MDKKSPLDTLPDDNPTPPEPVEPSPPFRRAVLYTLFLPVGAAGLHAAGSCFGWDLARPMACSPDYLFERHGDHYEGSQSSSAVVAPVTIR